MNTPLVIPTEKDPVILQQLTVEDAPIYFAAVDASREHLSQFGDETAAKYPTLETVEASLNNPSNPDKLRMGIWDGETFVGSINLTPDGDEAEVGYWIDSRYTGNGYATVATRALTGYAKQQRFRRIFANVSIGNEASTAVLRRSGFIETARNAGSLAFELASKVDDANYESRYSIETITDPEQYLTTEHIRAFREQHMPDITPQRADRAFGILIHPSIGGTALSKRHPIEPSELGLVVKSRDETYLPMPAKDAIVSNLDVVQVGSLLDFAETKMTNAHLWGLNKETKRFLNELVDFLKSQIEASTDEVAQA